MHRRTLMTAAGAGLAATLAAGHIALRGNGEAGYAGWASMPRIEAMREVPTARSAITCNPRPIGPA